MNEIWKDIKGFEGLYQVSNLGRIKSLSRVVRCGNYAERVTPEHFMALRKVHKDGYRQVTLSDKRVNKAFYVHRLVAQAFIPNPDNLPCVNHKDENPNNNKADNLEWCTYKYNSNYGNCKLKQSLKMKGRYKNPRIFECYKNNWKTAQIPKRKKVCQLSLSGELIKVWESTYSTVEYGFAREHVAECAKKCRKTHKGFKWVWYDEYIKEHNGSITIS